ncbi:VOC family protein [Paenibacillus sp. SC116]|uniref:VOC family protein n=1 Tax=Paenibacillus sp. SC116 TaxID=2968986 RepID=UPI00215B23F5|nr:VOC family protein [Paenibacillus sp. SC116]MCR8842452.1 VOC family protein [Paenibacillus sp. SC116]
MKPRVSIITLAVDDLDKSLAFYRYGLGLSDITLGGDHILFQLEGDLSLVLYLRHEFDKSANQSSTTERHSAISLSHSADSKEEVDSILNKAKEAGGTIPTEAIEYDWGYTGYFKDPDGHLWEIVYFKS